MNEPTDPEHWRDVLGRNADHYLSHFERVELSGRRWAPGWNSAAFVHSTGWLMYRRMYAWAVLNLAAPLLLAVAVSVASVQFALGERFDGLGVAVAWAYLAFVFIVVPVFADSFYYAQLKRLGEKAKAPSGGTATGAVLVSILWAWWFVEVINSAYADYNPRARVSESVTIAASLRPSIEEYYRQNHRLPGPGEANSFMLKEPMKYASSVAWDPARKAIVATMKGEYGGARFEWAAEEKAGALAWTCRSVDIEPKYLPASCRH